MGPPRKSVGREGRNEKLSPRAIQHLETEKMRTASNGGRESRVVSRKWKKGFRMDVINFVKFCGSSSKRAAGWLVDLRMWMWGAANVDHSSLRRPPPRGGVCWPPWNPGWLCELQWPAGLWQTRRKHGLARSRALGSSSLLLSGTLSPPRERARGR